MGRYHGWTHTKTMDEWADRQAGFSLVSSYEIISHKQSAALWAGMAGIWICSTQPGLDEAGLDCMGLDGSIVA